MDKATEISLRVKEYVNKYGKLFDENFVADLIRPHLVPEKERICGNCDNFAGYVNECYSGYSDEPTFTSPACKHFKPEATK